MRGESRLAGIVFIAAEEESVPLVRRVARRLGMGIEIHVAHGEARKRLAVEASSRGAEAIVSRWGFDLTAMEQKVDTPLVDVKVTGYDIALALQRAHRLGPPIGVIANSSIVNGALKIASAFGLDIVGYEVIESLRETDLKTALARLKDRGVGIILGGVTVTTMAPALGMRGIFIAPGEEAISDALMEADKLVEVRRREKLRAEQIRLILDFAYDGIIAVNDQGIVTVFNRMAEEITKLKADMVLGKPADSALRVIGLSEPMMAQRAEVGKLARLGASQIAINRVPIIIDGRAAGAVATFLDIGRIQSLEHRIRRELSTRGLIAKYHFEDIIGESAEIARAIGIARKYSKLDAPLLITGETGTGKEIFAQSVHNESPRRDGPFVAINCAALPESLLESELFGYVEGAFTGARKQGKIGLFELAHRGTVFLDEIGEMPLRIQARFLRVLEQNEVMRIGDDKVIPVDVRVIAATNRDLAELVSHGFFRADLYYRLNVLNLRLPPLRERKQDIPLLLRHFLVESQRKAGKLVRVEEDKLVRTFQSHDWPGNVRELRNMVERLVALSDDGCITDELANRLLAEEGTGFHLANRIGSPGCLSDVERETVLTVLKQVGGNRRRAAELLGISVTTLWRKLKKWGETQSMSRVEH